MNFPILYGQKIVGKVILSDDSPAEFATVVLLQASDKSLVKGAITDEKGVYDIPQIKNGNYVISINYVGYDNFVSKVIEFTGTDLTFPDIQLKTARTELATVQIVARRPLIEVKADRTVFNVAASIISAGANGLELMRKTPGITIDNNDNIALQGKNGVILYFDGKRSYLEPQELANLLRSLNAADIESIEVITNPSARYDASGNAGIVNIVTKKGKMMGTNGTLNLTTAYQWALKNNASINLNHRGDGFNIFGGGSIGKNKFISELDAAKQQDNRLFDQYIDNTFSNIPVNGKLGFDYSKTPKHSFGFLATANSNMGKRRFYQDAKTYISNGYGKSIDSVLNAISETNNSFVNANTNVNYRFADTIGNEWTIDLDKGYFNTDAANYQPNTFTNGNETQTLSAKNYATNSNATINIYTAKTDFEHKFKQSGISLSTGLKYARVVSNNNFDFFNVIQNEKILDITQTNKFKYTEAVTAAYLNVLLPLQRKWTIQAGLRWENTHSIGDLKRHISQTPKPEDYVERQYDNFFPSATLSYTINPKYSIHLSYSRRVDRPVYEYLNPFEWRIDELSFRKGSPFLRPQFSNNYEAKYVLNGSTTIVASYSIANDIITNIVEINNAAPDKIFSNYRNLATRKYYALTMSTPTNFKSWWNGFINLTLFKATTIADFQEYTFNLTTPLSINLFAQETFTFGKGWAFEVSGWYNSRTIQPEGFVVVPMASVDMGIQKKILNDQATLKLSYTDLFLTANWEGKNDAISGLSVHTTTRRETRLLQLNFNYRFGKTTVKNANNRKTGIEDEKGRIRE